MAYDLAKISMSALLRPAFDAGVSLTRLDERIARPPVGAGLLERSHYADACASLWTDGELVHLEDLVLHDAFRDTRTPTHELTIARDVLRTRRRIAFQSPDWALSDDGIRTLRQTQAWPGPSDGFESAANDRRVEPPQLVEPEEEGMTSMTQRVSPELTTPPSMHCLRALTPRSNEPKSLAGLRPIR